MSKSMKITSITTIEQARKLTVSEWKESKAPIIVGIVDIIADNVLDMVMRTKTSLSFMEGSFMCNGSDLSNLEFTLHCEHEHAESGTL